ncbi:hypothetical protein RB653_006145 [Dictyostelium firmibasis]|uniref:Uncharacterized protein n=1 Tax=Dictyostelium firmibasis TaxID=79012 RepID=A0AAN7UCY5_9MYCE
MTILSKVLVATGFLYGIYHVNNLVQEYKEYSAEQGYTLGDFGFEQSGDLARVQKKKPQTRGSQSQIQQKFSEEIQQLSARSKQCMDKGDIKSALPLLQRIVEIGQEYPPFSSYGKNAIFFIIKFAQEVGEDDLCVKYCKIAMESFEDATPEEFDEVGKMAVELADRLVGIEKDTEAIDLLKYSMERYGFSDKTKVDLLLHMAGVYAKNPKLNKKELSTISKALKIAKSSKLSVPIINTYLCLHEFYSKVSNVEKMNEVVKEIEEYLEPKFEMTIYRFFSENAKKFNHYDEYYTLLDKTIESVKKTITDEVNKQNIIISYKLSKAENLVSREMIDEAKKIFDEVKQNEYFCFATKSKSKYLIVDAVSSIDGVQTIEIAQKPTTTLPEQNTILVVEFENSYLQEESKEKKEEEVEKSEEDVKVEGEEEKVEQISEQVEEQEQEKEVEQLKEEKVEEPIKEEEKVEQSEEKVEEPVKEEEKVEQPEEKVEQPEEKVEEPVKEEIVEESEKVEESEIVEVEESSGSKITEIIEIEEVKSSQKVVEFVPSVTVEKPFSGSSLTFKNDSSKLASDIGYLAKISLYNSDKTRLIDSLYQLIPPETPKHQIN